MLVLAKFRNVRLGRYATTLSSAQAAALASAKASKQKETLHIPEVERTLQRFWKTVNVSAAEDGHRIQLDDKPIRTPAGKHLVIPVRKKHLAYLVAAEWNSLATASIKPHSLPLTSIAARGVDMSTAKERREIIESLIKYLDTDTLLCYAPTSEYDGRLRAEQMQFCEPIRQWAEKLFKVRLSAMDGDEGIIPHRQSDETKAKVINFLVEKLDKFQTAGFERAVMSSKSFLTGVALVSRRLNVEEAADGATLEVKHQTRRWGEVEDTHDVDHADLRRQLGSVHCAIIGYES